MVNNKNFLPDFQYDIETDFQYTPYPAQCVASF